MKTGFLTAATLVALCGQAIAQPTLDGSLAGDQSFYGPIKWVQNIPTGFGDNNVGDQIPGGTGDVGDPENVTTGIEITIPRSALGGATSFRLTGWVNSGDRGFLSNQTIHDGSFPVDTNNLGNAPDFSAGLAAQDFVSVNLAATANATPTIDGTLDGGVAGTQYTRVFLQTNYTQFGDSQAGTEIGGGGSEIDAVYIADDATNIYIFVAGNLEANGNGLDLYFDTDNGATGVATLGSSSGDGAFITNAQTGLVFETGFAANFVASVSAFDDDSDGMTPNVPQAFFGVPGGTINQIGNIAGYGAANAGPLSGGFALAVDNSNVAGVVGSAITAPPSPAAPNVDFAYGSEINGVYSYIDNTARKLWLLVTGNMEVNRNRLHLFFDVQDGGQNTIRNDNIDISFNGLNQMADLTFDTAFSPDYWLNFNTNIDPNLVNFIDGAVLRTNGPLLDPFSGLILDYGAFFGGAISEFDGTPTDPRVKLMDFSGDRVDIQDGFTPSLFTNYGPRLTQADPVNPIPGLVMAILDNSNIAGVSDSDASGAAAVTTGFEICIDLDELGWDGMQDILLGGYISSSDFTFISNQVFGGLPTGTGNLGDVTMIDFSAIAGDQFVNLSAAGQPDCVADWNDDTFVNIFDILAYLEAWNSGDPEADLDGAGGNTIFDILNFLDQWSMGCP